MRIIPSEISDKTMSRGERLVFAALKALPDSTGVALHSLHLPMHDYKRVGEVDFVLITPSLLLFIEVKGGRIARTDAGWEYQPRNRRPHFSKEGPFGQVSSGMHALERQLGQKLGNLRDHGVAGGYLVITPDVDLPESTEYAPETYLGARAFDGGKGLAAALHRATDFWLSANRWAATPMPKELRNRLLAEIRPQFDKVPGLKVRMSALEETFEKLTNEQLEKLDELQDNPRLLWHGGAGSGKTFLAAEAARRWAVHHRVLVTCASPTLATYLAQRLAPEENITVLPYGALAEVAPGLFDRLIVDEAQDLMTAESLDRLGGILKGNLDGGRWIFMLDRNNQILSPERFDTDAYEYLQSLGSTSVNLSRNCRNTESIVNQVQIYTGADLGVAIAGKGEPVRYEEVRTADDEAAALDRHLDSLTAEQVGSGLITLVSLSGDWETSSARRSRRASKIRRLADTQGRTELNNRITWASVQDIKGLENRVICLIDLEPELLDGRLDAVYVAFTRARAHLWVACRPGVQKALLRLGAMQLKAGAAR
ncbi:nuclease-related domain-containing DEAD/DEAH box helicase [Streptomyces bugieae]